MIVAESFADGAFGFVLVNSALHFTTSDRRWACMAKQMLSVKSVPKSRIKHFIVGTSHERTYSFRKSAISAFGMKP
jgi:hypothetical protein